MSQTNQTSSGKTAPSASSLAGPRLGPSWRSTNQGGRGFQPPSAASTTTQEVSSGTTSESNRNSFSILDTDDEARSFSTITKTNEATAAVSVAAAAAAVASTSSPRRNFSSRSEGLRSAGIGGGAFGNRSSSSSSKGTAAAAASGGGRSLADLASRLPSSSGTTGGRTGSVNRRSGSGDDTHGLGRVSSTTKEYVEDKNVVRYTREKLLSMRPRTDPSAARPEGLKVLDGTPLLSAEPLDPVCWDIFDAEEIWNQSREQRRSTKSQSSGIPVRRDLDQHERRGSSRVEEDRWQRGVALPPPGEGSKRDSSNDRLESDNPDDLWDDPLSPTEAAADFSAFGGSLEDEPKKSNGNVFDLAMMAEATKKFDEEVRGVGESGSVGVMESHDHAVNPKRPLAGVGTTIRSGSGNDVNVFEDFDAPDAVTTDDDAIRPGTVTQSASSRLMQMIGVSTSEDKGLDSEDVIQPQPESTEPNVFGVFGAPTIVPSNPWGAPMPSVGGVGVGLDLNLKLREVSQPESQNVELEMRKKQLEEEKRRAALLAQQQAEQQVKQSVVPNQQPQTRHQPEYSQVELVLAERISTVLENCWGRADLMTILQTLHSDDSRVIPLLGSVDALRALIVRHPLRFALTKDPTFGSEMAALVMNNLQWQQHKAAEELQHRQQEEHQKMLAAKEAEARAKVEAQARLSQPVIITDAPWFYADPQGNIQGPFKAIEMRQWLEAGYFKGDLPISQNRNGGFRTLSSLFPDLSIAFIPTGPSEEEKARIAEMEARAASEARARAEAEAREASERMARAKAAQEAEATKMKESANRSNQSAQLKMLLGLGHGNSSEVAGVNNVQDSERVEPNSHNKGSKSKGKKVAANKVDESTSAPAAVQTPAWGGAGATSIQAKGKSMSEIQKEEAREAAQLARQKKSSTQTGGGWAGVAASGGTTAWSGAAVKAPSVGTSLGHSTGNAQQGRSKQQMSSTSSYSNANDSRLSTQKTLEEFGANDKMTPELESWCKQQMKKLNGSDDLTLVAFCMTLNDSVEIKQYLTAYLGSTPQVNNFASEFINRKNGTKQQEQWETTTSNKKGRKKKVTK